MKNLWKKWKVQISLIGGALVVASTYGTCTIEPAKEEKTSPPVEEEKTSSPVEKEKTSLPIEE